VKEGTITARRAGRDIFESTVWIDGFHKPEDCIYEMYCWPIEAKEELVAIHIERKMLKKAFEESMILIYRLRNKFSEQKPLSTQTPDVPDIFPLSK
jgi:hypothetical protein